MLSFFGCCLLTLLVSLLGGLLLFLALHPPVLLELTRQHQQQRRRSSVGVTGLEEEEVTELSFVCASLGPLNTRELSMEGNYTFLETIL